jgi:hypothetical protein
VPARGGGEDGGPAAAAGAAWPQRSVAALRLAACAALLAALRPAVLASCPGMTTAQLEVMLDALLSQALAPGTDSAADVGVGAAGWAALAAASVLNKWKPGALGYLW